MGMVGTLIGLIQMLSNMDDPSSIGPAMAVALLTTLYGVLLANIVAKPIAEKLETRMDHQEKIQSLWQAEFILMSKAAQASFHTSSAQELAPIKAQIEKYLALNLRSTYLVN